jgi:hypothetical protein
MSSSLYICEVPRIDSLEKICSVLVSVVDRGVVEEGETDIEGEVDRE